MSNPRYRIYKDSKGEWRWTFYALNGEEIGVGSEGYETLAGCENSVRIMQDSGKGTQVEVEREQKTAPEPIPEAPKATKKRRKAK